MKVTNGWISNSSSSSFVLKFENEITEQDCERILDNAFGKGERPKQVEKLYNSFKRITDKNYDDFWLEDLISKDEIKKEEKNGYVVYYLSLGDHPSDSDGVFSTDDPSDREYLPLECIWNWGRMPDEVIAYENRH